MSIAMDLLLDPEERLKIKRDQYDRPLVPHPATGRIHSWTRVTTLAGELKDRYALEKHAKREVVRGMALRPRLQLSAVAAGDDKDALAEVVQEAEQAADSKGKAAIGTALHRLCALYNLGEVVDPAPIPEEWRPDFLAYADLFTAAGLQPFEGHVERFVVVPKVGAAGTPDLLVTRPGQRLPQIADIKTGAGVVRYGQLETAAQLATYAHASHWYDGADLHPMPAVDLAEGLVIHLPAGTGKAALYKVNLEAGWRVAQLAFVARGLRKESDRWFTPL